LAWEDYTATDFIAEIKEEIEKKKMLNEYATSAHLMGSAFSFVVTADNETRGRALLNDCIGEVRRIEAKLTEFNETSETSLINAHAGTKAVTVSAETYQLIQRCWNISALTGGAFDISAGGLRKLYQFRNGPGSLPGKAAVRAALETCGFKKIRLESGNRVFLNTRGMRIGFGAIGKGYAADSVKKLMLEKGVKCGFINASGDLTAWGTRADGTAWKTGIAHPDDPARIILWLSLNDLCIATSGNYEQYFEVEGKRYSHNIDPKTGYPTTGIKSVSVLSPAAELSDALATAVSVMGVKAGLHLINRLPRTHCIIIDDNNKIFSSEKTNINTKA
jgi:thiamine biosynthesis lipoprotein